MKVKLEGVDTTLRSTYSKETAPTSTLLQIGAPFLLSSFNSTMNTPLSFEGKSSILQSWHTLQNMVSVDPTPLQVWEGHRWRNKNDATPMHQNTLSSMWDPQQDKPWNLPLDVGLTQIISNNLPTVKTWQKFI